MKDAIIGASIGYKWDHLKNWVRSIKDTGFAGDVILVGANMDKDTIDKLTAEGVTVHLIGQTNEDGSVSSKPIVGAPHVERFFHIWNFLENVNDDYRFVVVTDTRDVIFQKNPIDDLEKMLMMHRMVASSEGMSYANEPWGKNNYLQAFGGFFYNQIKDKIIDNVGVIAGDHQVIKTLMLLLFQLSFGRPIEVVDQAVYNFLLTQHPYIDETYFAGNDDGWAIQLGTTEEAVKAGAGDLGQSVQNPSQKIIYDTTYEDDQPVYEDGLVKNKRGITFTIVHQYDRVPALKKLIEERYA